MVAAGNQGRPQELALGLDLGGMLAHGVGRKSVPDKRSSMSTNTEAGKYITV